MKNKLKSVARQWLPVLKENAEQLVFRQFPDKLMLFLEKYFRLQVEGIEHIPQRGAFILAANHSGFSGLDAMIIAHIVRKQTRRQVRVLTHRLWFMTKVTAVPAERLGFTEANMRNGLKILEKKQPILIFPEGELGNFKPSTKAYDLQEFKTGFVRLALKSSAPIIPILVIGAEESHINLSQLKLSQYFKGLVLPIPLNLVPLPAKWRIQFLPPVHLPFESDKADDREITTELAEEIRSSMQKGLHPLLLRRGTAY